ncbi:MAG: KamA family radical SAM protein [Candidatus Omnitrophota bacterium]
METENRETSVVNDEPPGCSSASESWKWQLINSVKDLDVLSDLFYFDAGKKQSLERVIKEYPFRVTPYYLSLINKTDPDDPIRRQAIPSPEEENFYIEVQNDPLGEEKDTVMPGLVHRYPDRVLVTLTNMCPMLCRHCTRKREWQGGNWVRSPKELEEIYKYIFLHEEITDVILSGGDPLILSTEKLEGILASLRSIKHIEIVRIGTRCPVVLPQRIDESLVAVLKKYRPIWVNTHFNHPNEITAESSKACDRLLLNGIQVNNQTVLLKGVNDDPKTMIRLCKGLLKIGVRPYYLFHCDPVSGAGHFRTSIDKGLSIIKEMRGFISGLAVPTYVVDGLEGQGKVPLQPDNLVSKEKDYFTLRGYKGEAFNYYNIEEKEHENRHNLQSKR